MELPISKDQQIITFTRQEFVEFLCKLTQEFDKSDQKYEGIICHDTEGIIERMTGIKLELKPYDDVYVEVTGDEINGSNKDSNV